MLIADVNIFVYAHREDAEDHERYREWLTSVLERDEPFGVSDIVLSGFIRVATNPRAWKVPSRMQDALAFVSDIHEAPSSVRVSPGERHWQIFEALCRRPGIRGNLVPDAYYAALAIEHGADWITNDAGFARFPNLRWRHPFDPS